jgi:hypothetical protein
MKSNYLDAIKWIDQQLVKDNLKIKMPGKTVYDLHCSLRINKLQILQNSGCVSYSSFSRTRKIKDYLKKISIFTNDLKKSNVK